MTSTGSSPSGWWMHHGDEAHTVYRGKAMVTRCAVWGSIAYDHAPGRLYCPTGNLVPDSELPSKGCSKKDQVP
jgi:glucose dehydrogenase